MTASYKMIEVTVKKICLFSLVFDVLATNELYYIGRH